MARATVQKMKTFGGLMKIEALQNTAAVPKPIR